jgi:hypothetical protein
MRFPILALSFSLLLSTGFAASAYAESFVGIVKTMEGNPTIIRNGEPQAAVRGMQVRKGDRVKTDSSGAIGLVFSDDTVLSMGPDTEITLDDYLFEPVNGRLSFVAAILRGTVCYLSGQIAKLAPSAIRLVMPNASIGVRGTRVLIKVEQGTE